MTRPPDSTPWAGYENYPPCPLCGAASVAQMTDHSCPMCEDSYRYCVACGEARAAAEGDDEEEEDDPG